jgi:hypothetical protein
MKSKSLSTRLVAHGVDQCMGFTCDGRVWKMEKGPMVAMVGCVSGGRAIKFDLLWVCPLIDNYVILSSPLFYSTFSLLFL